MQRRGRSGGVRAWLVVGICVASGGASFQDGPAQDAPAEEAPAQEVPAEETEFQDAPAATTPQDGISLEVHGGQVIVPGQVPGQIPGAVPPGALPPGANPGGEMPAAVAPDGSQPTGESNAEGGDSGLIQRPTEPSQPADPTELQARPDANGEIRIVLRGQKWPGVLEWFADISHTSVDWIELPNDYVNIVTTQSYTVEEVRDLLNRHLLARGFTMLKNGEFISVVKCEGLSTGLVPRVQPEDLDTLMPHEFVKMSFRLDWLLAGDISKEIETYLSSNGKVTPLTGTNRLEVMDAAANLIQIRDILSEEQSPDRREQMVRAFPLRFARADQVKLMIEEFLQSSGGGGGMPAGMTPEQIQAMQQQQQMMAQQAMMAGGEVVVQPTMPGAAGGAGPADVRLLVNSANNSLVVHAPPDKLVLIFDLIQMLDVPSMRGGGLQSTVNRMQVYRLAQLDPQTVITALMDIGVLDPTTELYADEAQRAIVAHASAADHIIIQQTLAKLDGTARTVTVIPLRDLDAEEVAGTIEYIMGGERDDSSRSGMPEYFIFGWPSPSRRNERRPDEFRVDADTVNNQLLVRANDVELEEVRSILRQLGQLYEGDFRPGDLTRVIDLGPHDDQAAFLQLLQQQWNAVGGNPLVIDPRMLETPSERPEGLEPSSAPPDTDPRPEETGEEESNEEESDDDSQALRIPLPPARGESSVVTPAVFTQEGGLGRGAEFPQDSEAPTGNPPEGEGAVAPPTGQPLGAQPQGPPIVITRDARGRLMMTSRDPAALAMIEEMANRLAPPMRDFYVFHLENAPASWVRINLEKFFKDEDDRRSSSGFDFFGYPRPREESERRRLSRRKEIRFISDLDTNTILVQNADPIQLRTIAELIELYDVPEPQSAQTKRVTELIPIRYSDANVIAETIKSAFRDLLSENDPALAQHQQQQQEQQRVAAGTTYITNFGPGEENSGAPERTPVRFKGKLSIGVDPVSNSLLVSAEGDSLMGVVRQMIQSLDEAARPVSHVAVRPLRGDMNGEQLQAVLQRMLAPEGQTPEAPQVPGQPQPGVPQGVPAGAVPGQAVAAPAAVGGG